MGRSRGGLTTKIHAVVDASGLPLRFALSFFNKLKQFRRIATRYEKLAANHLAMIKIANIRIWLRVYEYTP